MTGTSHVLYARTAADRAQRTSPRTSSYQYHTHRTDRNPRQTQSAKGTCTSHGPIAVARAGTRILQPLRWRKCGALRSIQVRTPKPYFCRPSFPGGYRFTDL